jgi:hypothetical protein
MYKKAFLGKKIVNMDINVGFWELIQAEFALKTSFMLGKVPPRVHFAPTSPLGLDLSTSP